jgi:hypothetical protein
MSSDRSVTMKYLAEIAGVNPSLVRKYVRVLRSLVGDSDLFSAQEGFA